MVPCNICTQPQDRYHYIYFPDPWSDHVFPMCFYCLNAYLEQASTSLYRHVRDRATKSGRGCFGRSSRPRSNTRCT